MARRSVVIATTDLSRSRVAASSAARQTGASKCRRAWDVGARRCNGRPLMEVKVPVGRAADIGRCTEC